MSSFIHSITGGLARFSVYLLSFGPFGLLAIAFLDSVLVPMPGGVDAVLLVLSASRPAWMLIYVASATIGSTAGCLGLYRISRRAGHRALARFSDSKQKRVNQQRDQRRGTLRSNDQRAIASGGSFENHGQPFDHARFGKSFLYIQKKGRQ